eukprot:1160689-Pelagomonas_calceolata.AAC.2
MASMARPAHPPPWNLASKEKLMCLGIQPGHPMPTKWHLMVPDGIAQHTYTHSNAESQGWERPG